MVGIGIIQNIESIIINSMVMANNKKKTGRAKPLVAKAGVTKNRGRRYCGGGKLK